MGRRSPVLGYNHNVRYRGLVFHVQTEDSGIVNPHLFTHLFHGGVIVSTRKLVYDPDADDGVVKSLMQAQHKAVMKELRRGLFDDKIDINLRGTPGLLPRGADDGGGEDTNVGAAPTRPTSAAEQKALESIVDPGSSPVIQIVDEAGSDSHPSIELSVDEEPSEPEIKVTLHPTPPGVPIVTFASDKTTPSGAPDMRQRPGDSVPPLPPPPLDGRDVQRPKTPGRASTPPPMSSASLPPLPSGARPASTMRGAPPVPKQQQAMTPPVVVTRPITRDRPPEHRSDVSQAFESIGAPPTTEEIAEIHSPAPGSAPSPPGAAQQATGAERASEYIHKRGDRTGSMRDDIRSTKMPVITPPERPATQPLVKKGSQPGPPAERQVGPTGRPGSGPIAVPNADRGARPSVVTSDPRPPTAPPIAQPPPRAGGPPPVPSRTGSPGVPGTRGTPPESAIPIPRTRTPTAPRPFSASQSAPRQGTPAPARPRTGSGPSGGGVVMSRPAVIVGGRSSNPPPPPAQSHHGADRTPPPPDQPRTSTGTGARVRRAREEGGRGVFGQDLISEKSLDEVILAYLSEDANEE